MQNQESNKEIWIFLSHSNEDYEKVRRVRNILEDMNTRPLMFFLKCLDDTAEIEDLIKREIDARTRFILCDSVNARKSNWVTKEINYINEKNKPYDIIDISANEDDIRRKLKNCFRREHIFISYPRELLPAINVVHERLSKYDFCTSFIDKFDISSGIPLLDDFESNIAKSVSDGYFISLLSHHSLMEGRFSQYELERALELDIDHKSIIPILLDVKAKSHFHNKLGHYQNIDLSTPHTSHNGLPDAKDIPYRHGNIDTVEDLRILGDDIVNSILVRLQGWGNIQTYAENFRLGRGLRQDIEEADKLGQLVVEHLEEVAWGNHYNGPGMFIVLGNLFKAGKVVKQDFVKALEYYKDAHQEYGISIESLMSGIPTEYL